MTHQRLAVIDIGTNSVRLLVGDVADDGTWFLVRRGRVPTRLGAGLAETREISADSIQRTEDALRALAQKAHDAHAERVAILATHALRAARNGADAQKRLERAAQSTIHVLSGEREAHLVFNGARGYRVPEVKGPLVCLDLGGGSLELACETETEPRVLSLPLGAVVVSERWGANLGDDGILLHRLRASTAEVLRSKAGEFAQLTSHVIGAGGTVTTTAKLLGVAKQSSGRSGVVLRLTQLEAQLEHLSQLDVSERARMPAIDDRADIIVPGLAVLCECMTHVGATTLTVLEHGVREGAILAMASGEL